MTTEQLIERLQELDPLGDREVVYRRHSDHVALQEEDLSLVRLVSPTGGSVTRDYYMEPHPTMAQADKDAVDTFLAFPGN